MSEQPSQPETESYICDQCNGPVGSDRVLVLTAAGQAARHMQCHDAIPKP